MSLGLLEVSLVIIALVALWEWRRAAARLQSHQEQLTALRQEYAAAASRMEQLAAELGAAQERAALEQALLDLLESAVIVTDPSGRLYRWNPAAEALVRPGVALREGLRLTEAFGSFALDEAIRQAGASGLPQALDLPLGPTLEQEMAIRMLTTETPAGRRVVVLLKDRTSSRAFQELRREFVTNVTHELKTPLTNIAGATETLLGGAVDDPAFRERFLEIILRNTAQLRALIEDLLLIARSEEASPEEAESASCDYRSVREMILSDLARVAEDAEVSFRSQALAEPVPLALSAADCYAILKNLTENAIRYNKRGGVVEFSERLREETVEITVRDTGIGIAPADLPRIFERFYRTDKQRSRAEGGTGLGLAIVKNLTERWGGAIQVESKLGLGSSFTLSLPRAGLRTAEVEAVGVVEGE